MRSLSSRRSQFLIRLKTSQPRTWEGVNPWRPRVGFFSPRCRSAGTCSIIAACWLRKSEMVCRMGSRQMPCCINSTSAKLICGAPVLPLSPASTFFCAFVLCRLSAFIAGSSRLQEFLEGTTVVQATTHLGYQLLGNVKRRTTSFYATVHNVTGVLLPALTGGTLLGHARATAEVEGTESRGPESSHLIVEPTQNVGGRFGSRLHAVYMTHIICTMQDKNIRRT